MAHSKIISRCFSALLLLLLVFLGCQHRLPTPDFGNKIMKDTTYNDGYDDKFGFLVLDAARVDSFFKNYHPLTYENRLFPAAFRSLLDSTSDSIAAPPAGYDQRISAYPTSKDLMETREALRRCYISADGKRSFESDLVSLFFWKCLPDSFRYKWSQDFLGDFRFNYTFLRKLQYESSEFQSWTYGEYPLSPDLKKIFGDMPASEISPVNARMILARLQTQRPLMDPRFAESRSRFMTFIRAASEGKCRLILIDWD